MINKEKLAIQCRNIYGPCFGARDFDVESNMKIGYTHVSSNCNFLSGNNLELTGGKGKFENFDVENFEVFKVNF